MSPQAQSHTETLLTCTVTCINCIIIAYECRHCINDIMCITTQVSLRTQPACLLIFKRYNDLRKWKLEKAMKGNIWQGLSSLCKFEFVLTFLYDHTCVSAHLLLFLKSHFYIHFIKNPKWFSPLRNFWKNSNAPFLDYFYCYYGLPRYIHSFKTVWMQLMR